ncbi:MAG: hypothetical protein M4D80_29545 [Myxococcota bacterium]|nr:hypothetical protein [Myxococcota bacterium]
MRVALILVLLAGVASADPTARLADAQRHFTDLDFELVIGDTDAVAADRDATPAHKTEALFLRGSALVVLEREPEAIAAFDALLAIDATYAPARSTPPRIRAVLAGARAARQVRLEEELATRDGEKLRAVTLDVDEPPAARGGLPLQLRVRLADPHRLVTRLVLGYRRESERDFASVSAPAATVVDLVIPGATLVSDRKYRLEWYVHGIHASGARVRQVGDEAKPRAIAIDAGRVPKPPGITSRWWFWAGLATVAASAIAVPILIDRGRDVGPQDIVIGK